MPDLPPLSEIIRRFGLTAQKKLGQNYLLDSNINKKITRFVAPKDEILMEIGAGPGGLTRALLELGAAHVFAVEYDHRFYPALETLVEHYPHRLTLVKEDARLVDPQQFGVKKITGNLPFNIATPLLGRWLMAETLKVETITVLVQKEVAQRMVAMHGSRLYGRLSLLCQWRATAKILFSVGARNFTPSPKVDAALVEITAQSSADDPSARAIETIGRMAFQKRRKMLRASLKPLAALLEKSGIDTTLRAEQLSVEAFRTLAKLYDEAGL